MDTFAPLINLLILLSVLSITAERLTNTIKLRRPGMRTKGRTADDEKTREKQITQASLGVCVLLAVVVKADLFAILAHLNAPWETIGWLTVDPAGGWVRSDALSSVGRFLYAFAGCAISGVGMTFGSKFWHDMLDIVFNARAQLKKLSERDT